MARLRVNPTRMEMLKIRRRLVAARRGHKLLKDKLEGLMQEFLELVGKYKAARLELDKELPAVMKGFVLASLASDRGAFATALEQSRDELVLVRSHERIMSVNVPTLEASFKASACGYSYLDMPRDLDAAVAALKGFFPKILRTAQLEQAVRIMAAEIEKTKRRVNALEYVMIPSLQETRKYISAKLEEIERGNITRLMKVKEMIMGR